MRAVFCNSDDLAERVLTEVFARAIRVPDDPAVVDFGGADFAAYLEPSLTTVQIDGSDIGSHVARQTLDRCRREPVNEPVIDLGCAIVER